MRYVALFVAVAAVLLVGGCFIVPAYSDATCWFCDDEPQYEYVPVKTASPVCLYYSVPEAAPAVPDSDGLPSPFVDNAPPVKTVSAAPAPEPEKLSPRDSLRESPFDEPPEVAKARPRRPSGKRRPAKAGRRSGHKCAD